MSLRNVGPGMAVLQGWATHPEPLRANVDPVAAHDARSLTRDLYVPAGDIGMWQGALRDPDHEWHGALRDVINRRSRFTIELLYTDNVGDQRTISRFAVSPAGDEGWVTSVSRHFYLDGPAPR